MNKDKFRYKTSLRNSALKDEYLSGDELKKKDKFENGYS